MESTPSTSFRALIFIVAYNAQRHIVSVLDRIPTSIWNKELYDCDILVIDDFSKDATWDVCNEYCERTGRKVTVLRTPTNQGYGGNQKLGYTYAIQKGYDAVVMLHGDGQYAPEMLPDMIAPMASGQSEVVFGSRMLKRRDALKGGMPKYKFAANIALTTVQNAMIGTRLSEFHTGYRAYATSALKRIPFRYNSDWFDFDTDIIIQLADQRIAVTEIAIPTHYGDEICHVDNMRYGTAILKACTQSRLQRYGIFYHRKFDYEPETVYRDKTHFASSHSFAVSQVMAGETVLVVGCGADHVEKALQAKGCKVERLAGDELDIHHYPQLQLDAVVILDIVGNTNSPEDFLEGLYERLKDTPSTRIIVTSPNIAFWITRAMLLLGRFEYGKRGILDKSHKRIFTFPSLRRLVQQSGFIVEQTKGIPAPFPLALRNQTLATILLKANQLALRLGRGLFSFQIGLVARPKQAFETVFANTLQSEKQR
ncbi:MAG: glycosyltransferase [Rickettsiales bacterium]|nr:glycosyltransferase [Rickettsiales bacterium]